MSYRYFEDFAVGEVIQLGICSVDEGEIIDFAQRYDPQTFHIDPEAARQSIFGGLIASGWHSCGMLMRLMVDSLLRESSSLGSPGIDEIRWLLPVRPGDTLTARYKVVDAKPSSSKPDRGVIFCACELENGHGQIVMTMRSRSMFGRRPR